MLRLFTKKVVLEESVVEEKEVIEKDEVVLSKHINPVVQMEKLRTLHASGKLNDEEFEAKKKELIELI